MHSGAFPKILSSKRTRISPWLELLEKAVQFAPDRAPELYHCISQAAYVGVLARTADGLFPIVQQYRPCVEAYTWELPAGTVDINETAERAGRRELLEETGFHAEEMVYLGNFYPDTGRLQIDSHGFYAVVPPSSSDLRPAPEFVMRLVTHDELKRMIVDGEFRHQIHLAIYAAVLARGIVLD